MRMFRCSNCKRLCTDADVQQEFYGEACPSCEEVGLVPLTNPHELMDMAEASNDKEKRHMLADAAMFAHMELLDHDFAQRYQGVRKAGFWYA